MNELVKLAVVEASDALGIWGCRHFSREHRESDSDRWLKSAERTLKVVHEQYGG
jgi:hypothetical protein